MNEQSQTANENSGPVWRHLAKFGSDFIKLTKDLDEALDFVKRLGLARVPKGEFKYSSVGWGDDQLKSFANRQAPEGCLKREYWIKPDGPPVFKINSRVELDQWLANRESGKWLFGHAATWSVCIPVQLKVRRLIAIGEVKVPGQIYQPAIQTWEETNWSPIYIEGNKFPGGETKLTANETEQRYEHVISRGQIDFIQTEEP